MTVFKEKKAGLLYLLGKGLVILSILAMAFAFIACGDSGSGSRWPDDHVCPPQQDCPVCGGQPLPIPPFVEWVEIVNREDLYRAVGSTTDPLGNFGFQGLPVSLEGAVLEVKWSDKPFSETIRLGADPQGFYTSPEAPELAGEDIGPFYVRHETFRNTSFSRNAFTIGRVIPINTVAVTRRPNSIVWYADYNPPFIDDIELGGVWRWVATVTELNNRIYYTHFPATPGDIAIALDTWDDMAYGRLAGEFAGAGMILMQNTSGIPFTMTNPRIDSSNAETNRFIRIGFGNFATFSDGTPHVDVPISRFVHVDNVAVESAGPNFFLLDDQFKDALVASGGDFKMPPGHVNFARNDIRDAMLRMIAANDVLFRVTYEDGSSRVINWDRMVGNRQYWDWKRGATPGDFSVNALWAASGALPTHFQDPMLNGIMPTGWGFTLDYIGRRQTDPFPSTPNVDYVKFTIEPDVYVFAGFGENAVTRRPGFNNPVYYQMPPASITEAHTRLGSPGDGPGVATGTNLPVSIRVVEGLLEEINKSYILEGRYTFNGQERTAPMTFVAGMFDTVSRDSGRPVRFDAWPQTNWAIPGVLPQHQPLQTNWPLNISWRGNTSVTGQSSVRVDVRAWAGSMAPTPVRRITGFVFPHLANRGTGVLNNTWATAGDFLASNANLVASVTNATWPVQPAPFVLAGAPATVQITLRVASPGFVFAPDFTLALRTLNPGALTPADVSTMTDYQFGTPINYVHLATPTGGTALAAVPIVDGVPAVVPDGSVRFDIPVTVRHVIRPITILGLIASTGEPIPTTVASASQWEFLHGTIGSWSDLIGVRSVEWRQGSTTAPVIAAGATFSDTDLRPYFLRLQLELPSGAAGNAYTFANRANATVATAADLGTVATIGGPSIRIERAWNNLDPSGFTPPVPRRDMIFWFQLLASPSS